MLEREESRVCVVLMRRRSNGRKVIAFVRMESVRKPGENET